MTDNFHQSLLESTSFHHFSSLFHHLSLIFTNFHPFPLIFIFFINFQQSLQVFINFHQFTLNFANFDQLVLETDNFDQSLLGSASFHQFSPAVYDFPPICTTMQEPARNCWFRFASGGRDARHVQYSRLIRAAAVHMLCAASEPRKPGLLEAVVLICCAHPLCCQQNILNNPGR